MSGFVLVVENAERVFGPFLTAQDADDWRLDRWCAQDPAIGEWQTVLPLQAAS